MTVMNDRPQGGSSLENGTIELMQNRRMMADDGKGAGVPLDEYEIPTRSYYGRGADASGGIKTNVVYRMEIFKTGAGRRSS